MKYRIAVFPGDGVGPELIKEGIKVLDKAAELDKFEIEWIKYPYGAGHYIESKELLPEKILKEIKNNCNAIFCGTFDTSLKEINVANSIRNYFDQFASLRPIKLLPSVECPLAGKTNNEINFAIIRENTEDFYIGAAGRAKNGRNKQQFEVNKGLCKAKLGIDVETKGNEVAYQIGILSRKGCERIAKYAFEYAKRKNNNKIMFVDNANLLESYNFWRENINKIAADYKDIECQFELIDATVMHLIRQPEKYQVIVAPNMFGDILMDFGTMMHGGLALGARGSINPDSISMFEPIHGSAPKLKDQGIINPIATIWAGALLLDNIGQGKSGSWVMKAIESVLKDGRTRTQDLDGNNTTSEMGEAITEKLVEIHD